MWKAGVEYSPAYGDDRLYLLRGEERVTSMEFESYNRGEILEPSMIEGVTDFLQAVMDEGWRHGIRPKGYGLVDEGTKEHLKDMREITRHLLKMDK